MHLTNNICTTIKLVLNGKSVASRSTSGLLHLQDDDNHIRLYIPREARQRKISYLAHVPERMVAYFAIEDRGAAKVFGDIFHSDLDILDDVLADHGIVSVPGVSAEPIPRDETGVSSLGSATHSPIRGFGNRSPLSDNTVVEEISSPPTSFTEVSSTESHSVPSIGAAGSNRGRCFPVELVSQTRTDPHGERYTALLDHVIKSATSDRGHVRLSIESFVPDEVFGPRATNRLLHDMRIGAAGELFVRTPLHIRHVHMLTLLPCRYLNICKTLCPPSRSQIGEAESGIMFACMKSTATCPVSMGPKQQT